MGGAFQRKSLYTWAIEMNTQFIALAQAAGDLVWEGVAMCNLGEVYCGIGEYGQALALCERSNIIARRVGDVEGQRVVSKCLGTCCYALAEYEKSLIFFNVQERAMCHHHLGHHKCAVALSRKYHSVSTSLPISTRPNAIGDKVCSMLQLGVMLLYQVYAQFAVEETAFTQTSDAMTKQLLEAACLLAEVVRMPESCQFFFYRTDALLGVPRISGCARGSLGEVNKRGSNIKP